MTNKVYKVDEITSEFISSLEFDVPILNKRSYFINNTTEFYIQLSAKFHTNFYKYSNKIYCSISCDKNANDMFLNFDNIFVNRIHKMFPLWFNKRIELEHLIEYYVPSVLIEDNIDENSSYNYDSNNSDDGSNDGSNDESDSDLNESDDEYNCNKNEIDSEDCDKNERDHKDNGDENVIDYVICEIPYEYVENDLDIMIYGSDDKLIENEWSNIKIKGKSCICIVKLKSIKIEDSKFYTIWEIIQIKLI
jgi:hypothetical protein